MKSSFSLVVLFPLVVVGCTVDQPAPSRDSQNVTAPPKKSQDPSDPSPTPSVAPDDGTSAPAGGTETTVGNCSDAAPANVPAFTSQVLSSAPPAPKGGDERGSWIATKATAYVTGLGGALIDAGQSKAEGNSFVKFDGKRFFTSSDIKMTVATKIAGKTVTSAVTKSAGTYSYADGNMTINPECIESTAEQTGAPPPKSTGFSRLSDTEALFMQTQDSEFGEVTLALTLKKAD
jgi:hypothetical protein